MYTSTLLDLRQKRCWDPGQLTAESFRWPTALPQVSIQDLVVRLSPKSIADPGAPVITPGDLDLNNGAVGSRSRNYQGIVYQVGSELSAGDVLVPRLGTIPALLITDHLQGALLSTGFWALRAYEPDFAEWIWAVLNSASGHRLRTHLSLGSSSAAVELAAILRASIPLPPPSRLASLKKVIEAIEVTTHLPEDQPAETWWGTADLREQEWRDALVTADHGQLQEGVPLGDFCTEITRGRNTAADTIDHDAPGYLAVATVSMLGGEPPKHWASADKDAEGHVIAQRGELLVAALGSFAYATIVNAPVVVDRHVYLIRLREQALGPTVANYLNSRSGYSLRQIFLRANTVPHLNESDLVRMPIPTNMLQGADSATETFVTPPLSHRLEQAIWDN